MLKPIVNYHRQRRWLDILALEGALLGLVVILYFGAFANRFIVFCTTEVMYLDLIITNHDANSISKIRSSAIKTLSSFFYQYCTAWPNLFGFPFIFTNLDAHQICHHSGNDVSLILLQLLQR